ncbi:MAG: elongation factor P maturation arginine rhamnosyltransferase EarP [Betaproteobacteria bacterium]|nr:elongation factor P maturation arginine rhamnosyltransferase EarP [Betaproteobacteria bacterium]
MADRLQRATIAVRVVDNFGDAGVAWRLARQLHREHACDVVLWIDDVATLARFVRGADAPDALVEGVRVRRLPPPDDRDAPLPDPWPHLLIEAFGCRLPATWLDAIEASRAPPVWINLEYLSAEDWVDGAHGLPSPHPTRNLKRWFFYPGFTGRTGGLLRERGLLERRDAFAADRACRARAWADAGLPPPPADALLASLFCYPGRAVDALLRAWAGGGQPVHALVPEGVASDAVGAWLGEQPQAGAVRAHGALTLAVVPFVDQDAFDRRLWACDFAVVRGEDSFVRAQWAAVPFAWHIYPQAEEAHRAKLEAFLGRYRRGLAPPVNDAFGALTRAWNVGDAAGVALGWPALATALHALRAHARGWAAALAGRPDLASQLVEFARTRV